MRLGLQPQTGTEDVFSTQTWVQRGWLACLAWMVCPLRRMIASQFPGALCWINQINPPG